MGAQWYNANISLLGCDKNMPGTLMVMGDLNATMMTTYIDVYQEPPKTLSSSIHNTLMAALNKYGTTLNKIWDNVNYFM